MSVVDKASHGLALDSGEFTPAEEFNRKAMTTPDLLQIMRLLSALESWGYSCDKPFPVHLSDQLTSALDILEREILAGQK